jgi:hypothetical protein
MKKILYVGLDVHKETISIACGSEREDIRHFGTIPNNAYFISITRLNFQSIFDVTGLFYT